MHRTGRHDQNFLGRFLAVGPGQCPDLELGWNQGQRDKMDSFIAGELNLLGEGLS